MTIKLELEAGLDALTPARRALIDLLVTLLEAGLIAPASAASAAEALRQVARRADPFADLPRPALIVAGPVFEVSQGVVQ